MFTGFYVFHFTLEIKIGKLIGSVKKFVSLEKNTSFLVRIKI